MFVQKSPHLGNSPGFASVPTLCFYWSSVMFAGHSLCWMVAWPTWDLIPARTITSSLGSSKLGPKELSTSVAGSLVAEVWKPSGAMLLGSWELLGCLERDWREPVWRCNGERWKVHHVSSSLVLVPEAPVGNPYLPNGFVLPMDLMNRCISVYL